MINSLFWLMLDLPIYKNKRKKPGTASQSRALRVQNKFVAVKLVCPMIIAVKTLSSVLFVIKRIGKVR